MTARLLTGVIIALAFVACSSETPPEPAPVVQSPATHVGAAACTSGHTEEHEAWLGSHHDLAMQPATPATVLGDFDNATFSYAGVQSTFTRRGDNYFVRTDGADGALTDYQIAYT